mmetsp:Transcript_30601/g.81410  ORF Transcript_30601/g.81410 Transcript_30601/m.81410 type:complete len:328 (+) Transcript_30601:125-1108(+)
MNHLSLKSVTYFGELVQKRRRTLTADTTRTVHHHTLALELLLRLGLIEPAREVARVAHLGVDQLGARLWRVEVADCALVGVAHVDDHGIVALLHQHLVVLVRLKVHPASGLERRCLLAREAVRDELVDLADGERFETLRVRDAVGEFEVGLLEDLVPLAQLHAEFADLVGVARERAVQPLRRAPTAAAHLELVAELDDEIHGLAVLLLIPDRLDVLVHEHQRHIVRLEPVRHRWQLLEAHRAGVRDHRVERRERRVGRVGDGSSLARGVAAGGAGLALALRRLLALGLLLRRLRLLRPLLLREGVHRGRRPKSTELQSTLAKAESIR